MTAESASLFLMAKPYSYGLLTPCPGEKQCALSLEVGSRELLEHEVTSVAFM